MDVTDADSPVVVVGGGLAGIAAALRLAENGRRVTVFETRPRLGGMAFSFTRGSLSVDNGQHVFLRCCEAYRWLLRRLGVTERTSLQPRLDIHVLCPDGRSGRLYRTAGVPAPAHLSAALARYGLLSPVNRLRTARAAIALRLLRLEDATLDERTLGEFLRRHGQSEQIIDSLWGLLATATLNLHPDQASLALAAKVFRTGVLDRASAGDIGYASAPLGELHSVAARRGLEQHGVRVRLGHHVEAVGDLGEVRVRSRAGTRTYWPDSVILAVPPRVAFRIAPGLADTDAAPARALRTSPIVNVHVIYDRRVTDLPFAAAVNSPVQWFFDRTRSSGLHAQRPGAQYLAITVSAADDIVGTSSTVLRERYIGALKNIMPEACRAEVLDCFVTRERHATFRQTAGTAPLRPGPVSGIDRLWLAGAWTKTGWPDTMEGAVRSGVHAAEAAMCLTPPEATRYAT